MNKLSIDRVELKGKRVLVRVDFNVPLKKVAQGEDFKYLVSDDQRIRSALETILFLKEHGAKIILISHLGRPDGKVSKEFSLSPVASYLNKNLGLNTTFAHDCIGEEVAQKRRSLATRKLTFPSRRRSQ